MPPGRSLNVLFIMSDQHSQAVSGCYGHEVVRTPSIDALAGRGTRFDNAFCASPLCSPSRVAWITGTHPHTNGVVTPNNSRHRSGEVYRVTIHPGVSSLVSRFRDAGYLTHGSGFLHVDDHVPGGGNPFEALGFSSYGADDRSYGIKVGEEVRRRYHMANTISEMWEHTYRNVEGRPFPHGEDEMWDSVITEDGLDFISRGDTGRPFFLYIGYRAPHPPWCAPARFHEMYDPDDVGDLPNYRVSYTDKPRRVIERVNYYELWNLSEEMIRNSIAAYYGFVSYLDHCIGRLMERLEDEGLLEDTLVVYTSDHGEMLYRNGICEKHTFFEGAIRIPLIVSLPGSLPEGASSDSLVCNIDLLPTILEMQEIEIPGFVEGVSILPTFEGRDVQDHVFAEYYHTLDPCRMVRGRRYKYIHTEEDVDELYDLEKDPTESINLAWYPQYSGKVREMEDLVMEGWEIPELPVWAPWNDLNERKQRLRLGGDRLIDPRPEIPDWVSDHRE